MRHKPMRKNPNKERIVSIKQNVKDFDYIKSHRGEVGAKEAELLKKKGDR